MLSNKISRLLIIINLLSENSNGLSKNEIVNAVETKFDLQNTPFDYKDLAFKRDLKDIRNDLNLEIIYNRKDDSYSLNSLIVDESKVELLLNSFKIFTTLIQHSGMPEFIIPEGRKASGLTHFGTISEAIGFRKYIEFQYFKYDSNVIENKKIKPFALKESKNRWYVIGAYENTEEIRTFGLDRIINLIVSTKSYKTKLSLTNINAYFNDSFAMFTNEKTEIVKLKFDLRDGNYIKSYPIHHSQKIVLSADKKSYNVFLNIQITLDFIMELMSRAWSIEVVEPLHLKQKLAKIFEEASRRNMN
jgi:proteasome accessory factor B